MFYALRVNNATTQPQTGAPDVAADSTSLIQAVKEKNDINSSSRLVKSLLFLFPLLFFFFGIQYSAYINYRGNDSYFTRYVVLSSFIYFFCVCVCGFVLIVTVAFIRVVFFLLYLSSWCCMFWHTTPKKIYSLRMVEQIQIR